MLLEEPFREKEIEWDLEMQPLLHRKTNLGYTRGSYAVKGDMSHFNDHHQFFINFLDEYNNLLSFIKVT